MSVESDPPWIKERTMDEDSPEDVSQSMRPTLTPLEATAELTKIRPVHSKPSDLKHILKCRADPNMPLEAGDITPLKKVMSFGQPASSQQPAASRWGPAAGGEALQI